jgi:hypothetical protein
MEGLKFRAVDAEEQSSVQEQEQHIQEEFEQSLGDTTQENAEEVVVKDEAEEKSLTDDEILQYLNAKYEKQLNSVEDIFKTPELPEDVKTLIDYGVENYIKVSKDWNSASDDEVLRNYYKMKKPHLDDEDIDYLIDSKYGFDEDVDSESDIKTKKVALKEELFEARNFLNSKKDELKLSLGSSAGLSEEQKKAYEFYKQYNATLEQEESQQKERSSVFMKKTEDFFNSFKGFEFDLGERKVGYKPDNVEEVKNNNLDVTNFIKKHLDENGVLKDAHSYHKALTMAMNPDAFAKFFYEQGKADATKGVIKDIKNVDMNVRDVKDIDTSDKPRIRAVQDDSFGSGLRIIKR